MKGLLLLGAAVVLLIAPATTQATPAAPKAAVAQLAQAPASPEWEELLRAARKEGELELILSGQVPQKLRPGMAQFEKKYGVRVNFQTGGGSAHAERILAERRVGRYTLDVWLGGANTALVSLVPNKALQSFPELLIDPEVNDKSAWFQGKHHYSDPESRYIFTYAASPNSPFSFNTKLVNPGEFKSFWDFLDPKWKGKIVSWSPGDQGTAPNALSLYLNPKVGEEWFRRWANEMNVTIVKDARQGAEWVALGRFPIGMFGLSTQAELLSTQGFPIDSMDLNMIEGDALVASASNLMVMDRAPHPNAAKLFVNWALSKEGQTLFIKLQQSMDSLRTDIPKDLIEERYRIRPDRDYLVTFTNPDYINRQAEYLTRLRKIMQDAGYR